MSTEEDRRAHGAARVGFDALVEVGGQLGPAFEAQAVDISEEGMHLRTAYLPEIGQPLTFRFDAGPGKQVAAACEVAWREEQGKGGEFGVRFTSLDGESVAALGRILGLGGPVSVAAPGARIRLHIDGLGSPMRARVKQSSAAEVTAFSELGFLQVGKQLELEDTQNGSKRPAFIDRVEVEIDPETRVPQLIVTLRYDDAEADAAAEDADMSDEGEPSHDTDQPREASPQPDMNDPAPASQARAAEAREVSAPATEESDDDAAAKMRGAIARGAAKVGPALTQALNRAKVTVALLAAKRRGASLSDLSPPRRTTAPPPGGGLHAAGRKVVRGAADADAKNEDLPEVAGTKKLVTKRRAIVAGAVGAAGLLAMIAMHKPAPVAPLASAPPPEPTTEITSQPIPAAVAPEPVSPIPGAAPAPLDPTALSSAAKDDRELHAPKKHPSPFGNGPVAHGNLLRLKMDGPIDKIEGAQLPTGFSVVIPNRRSLEAAGPLAARDGRIASIRVSNDPTGAELALAFKDGVPNYQVRARGDTLEIVLAPIGQVAEPKPGIHAQAKSTDNTAKPHGKNNHGGHSKRD